MKEINITSKRLKKELFFWLVALAIAGLLNVFSILKYKTSWTELVTQAGFVIAISFVIYLLIALIRSLIKMISK